MKRASKKTLAGFFLACLLVALVGIVVMRASAPAATEQAAPALEIKPPVEETVQEWTPKAAEVCATVFVPESHRTPARQVTSNLENAHESTVSGVKTVEKSSADQVREPEPEATETPINPVDLELLACAIYQEAGGDYIADETRYRVGDVVLNRVADERFPDTIAEVLTQQGQYGTFYWTGVCWPDRAAYEPEAVQRAYDTARNLLAGTRHSDLYGQGYIWQAEFVQGTDVIYADGLYFGR